MLLEAREIGWGASGRNGGQAIHGLACDQATIEAQLGLDDGPARLGMSIEALDLMRAAHARASRIDCDWRDGYLGLATNARKARDAARLAPTRMQRVYGYPLQRIAPRRAAALDRQPALPQRRRTTRARATCTR